MSGKRVLWQVAVRQCGNEMFTIRLDGSLMVTGKGWLTSSAEMSIDEGIPGVNVRLVTSTAGVLLPAETSMKAIGVSTY